MVGMKPPSQHLQGSILFLQRCSTVCPTISVNGAAEPAQHLSLFEYLSLTLTIICVRNYPAP